MNALPILVMGAGVLCVLVLMVFAFSGPSVEKAKARRLIALRDRHSNSTGAVVEAQMRRIQANRATRMDGFAGRILPNAAQLQKRLAMTGKTWTPSQYVMASMGTLVVVTLLVWLRSKNFTMGIALGGAIGLGVPHFVVNHLIKRRINQFTKRFPDAIDLLVRGLRSGLPISETLNVVGAEVPGPVGVEFRAVSDKIKIGRTMDAALQETADRLGTPEFQFFVITIQIQRETGGNLAETLSNLANVLRSRAQMKLKIKAMSSESKASAYIIGSLPFIVFGLIYTINDTYMQQFFTNPKLITAGLGAGCWMGLGAFVMSRMIAFEI
ncbi:MAG: type II secretion system F family protein [Sphingomonadales bacterium]